ncbi:DNA mismatch repair protein MutT [Alkalibacillus haloalkaliphilus]|uniref:DNA mismatch repair protein MutT n=1 Tax=Alkalibacillus haloalkaliphilus TaxID=94136 RepID=A0A511W4X4_9BACI|nr:DNA mismatch repair protein MutT [Alkalibacillus haloalkaliphilus]
MVLIEDQKVVLIKRVREGSVYYVFPGGGIEEGETPEEATKREALEELGVEVRVGECLEKLIFNDGTQYFFLSEIVSGTIGSGKGEEYTDSSRNRGTYEPMWVDIARLPFLNVKPKEIALKVQSLIK